MSYAKEQKRRQNEMLFFNSVRTQWVVVIGKAKTMEPVSPDGIKAQEELVKLIDDTEKEYLAQHPLHYLAKLKIMQNAMLPCSKLLDKIRDAEIQHALMKCAVIAAFDERLEEDKIAK